MTLDKEVSHHNKGREKINSDKILLNPSPLRCDYFTHYTTVTARSSLLSHAKRERNVPPGVVDDNDLNDDSF